MLSVLQPRKNFQSSNTRQHKAAVPERGGTNELSPRIASLHLGRVSRLLKERGPQLPLSQETETEPEQPTQLVCTGQRPGEKRAGEGRGASKTLGAPRRPEHGQNRHVRGLLKYKEGPPQRSQGFHLQSSHRPGTFYTPSSPSANPLGSQHIK